MNNKKLDPILIYLEGSHLATYWACERGETCWSNTDIVVCNKFAIAGLRLAIGNGPNRNFTLLEGVASSSFGYIE